MNIVIPWIITGTAIFLFVAIKNDTLSLVNWFNYIIGNFSHLYYLSILMMLFFILYRIKNKYILFFMMLLSIISITLTNNNLLPMIVPSLNPFNYMIYFIIGMLIGKIGLMNFIDKIKINNFTLLFILLSTIFIVNIIFKTTGYNINIIRQPFLILFVLKIATNKIFYNWVCLNIGKQSFAIYLLHLPVAGVVVMLTNLLGNGIITLIRPIIVIFIVGLVILFYKNIKIFGLEEKHKNLLIGKN